jgi:hypothetical protein
MLRLYHRLILFLSFFRGSRPLLSCSPDGKSLVPKPKIKTTTSGVFRQEMELHGTGVRHVLKVAGGNRVLAMFPDRQPAIVPVPKEEGSIYYLAAWDSTWTPAALPRSQAASPAFWSWATTHRTYGYRAISSRPCSTSRYAMPLGSIPFRSLR